MDGQVEAVAVFELPDQGPRRPGQGQLVPEHPKTFRWRRFPWVGMQV